MTHPDKINRVKKGKRPGFTTLIPSGIGFPRDRLITASDEPDTDEMLIANQYRCKFLDACQYFSTRLNDMEKLLYIKTTFILRNQTRLSGQSMSEALLWLAADQETLFKDGDGAYRSRKHNEYALSEQRKQHREIASPEVQAQLIQRSLVWSQTLPDTRYRLLDETLLRRIIAENSYRGVYRWVYSKNHVRMTTANRGEYKSKFVRFQENFGNLPLDKDMRETLLSQWLDNPVSVRRLIDLCLKEGNPNDVGILDLVSLKADCWALLTEEEQHSVGGLLQDEHFDDFVSLVLREYMYQYKAYKKNAPSVSSYHIDDKQAAVDARGLERRYRRLQDLEKAFAKPVISEKILENITAWGMSLEPYAAVENEIIRAIQMFFYQVGVSLTDNEPILRARIDWASSKVCRSLLPVLLVLMTLSLGRRITHTIEPECDSSAFPRRLKNVNHAVQRYAELLLLDKFCNIYKLSAKDRIKNWESYIYYQGEQILSREEYHFWCRQLNRQQYEELPCIGLQLCYINYCTQCLPPHYETLSYRSAAPLHLGGYHKIWKESKHNIMWMARQLGKEQQKDISAYKMLWENTSLHNDDRRAVIEKFASIHVDLDAFPSAALYDQKELNCLVTETILRIYLQCQARKFLLKKFQMIGGFSLVDAVYRQIKLADGKEQFGD